MDNRVDAIGALAFALFGGLFLTLAATAPTRTMQHDALGPYFAPVGLAILMVVLGCLQAWRSLHLLRTVGRYGPHEGKEDELGHPVSQARSLAFTAAVLLYPYLLLHIGYLIVTPVLIVAGLWSLHYRRVGRLLVATVVFTAAVQFVFESVLSVPLPDGLLA